MLSDVLSGFLSNFTKLLKMNSESCSETGRGGGGGRGGGCRGFHDALECSLHQVGMGGKGGIYGYWRNSVQANARRLEMEADELGKHYLRLTVSAFS